ncbi:MAG: LysM peptidoglycan-binding domain-containing protein [Lentisphaeria bacterium]|nr:LysM peptidoglycan-binding domain-containing protein [Lentisphaeria bacterium]
MEMKIAGRVFLVLFSVTCLTGCRHRLAEQPLTPRQREWAERMDSWNWKWRLPYHAPVRSFRSSSNASSRSIPPRQTLPPVMTTGPVLGDTDMPDSFELPPLTDLPPVMTDDDVVFVPMETTPADLAAPSVKKTHTVAKGDTLSGIAIRHYGKAELWRRIYDANREAIDSPDNLKVGSVLTIPPTD